MTDLKDLVASHKATIVAWRRKLHRIPEIGFREKKTAALVAQALSQLELEVTTAVARHGVVGLLTPGSPLPRDAKTVLIRADMDALPIQEETGLSFASTHDKVMHACGHDGHMAMVLGAALVLNSLKGKLNGHVKFVFQPAEEGPGGAQPMIAAGVMEHPRVDYSIGMHLWPALPEGSIGVKSGTLMAAMDWFDLTIVGKGGHGAMPHLCVDPIDTGVQVVNALQRLVSRRMNPLNPSVVTIGSFHGGSTFNIIPDQVKLSGTTRTFDRDTWLAWPHRVERIVRGICEATGAAYELAYHQGYPPVVNDGDMTALARRCAIKVVGKEEVVEPEASMGGEDMAHFLEASKGCYLFLGTGRDGSSPLHNSRFDFNEDVLLIGVEAYCRMVLDLLG